MLNRREAIKAGIAALFAVAYKNVVPPVLVDDEESSTSYPSCCGCAVHSPIVFDDALIKGAVLHGDYFPFVTTSVRKIRP